MADQNGKKGLPRPLAEERKGADALQGILGVTPDCKYIKRKLLGQGSFGSAWRVEESATKRILAAKVMDLNSMSAKDRGFVTNEVKCLSRCHNPHIVRCEESIEKDGILVIIMEYADGGDLYKQIKARQQSTRFFKEHEVIFIFLQLCLAIDHIHSNKMMHRDLKTANVLLTTTGLIKLGDFGFSRQYEDSLSNPVGTTFCGTPYYLSPELWHRKPYSKKSEMWALGVVIYEVMALRRPFGGRNMDELISNICKSSREPLPETYSAEMRAICDSLLQVDAAKRPALRELFGQPFVRKHLEILQQSVQRHTQIAPQTREDIGRCVSEALKAGSTSTPEPPKTPVAPRKGMVQQHNSAAGWQDCELSLDDQKVTVRNIAAATEQNIPLNTITSVIPIEETIAGTKFVFAMKDMTGKAFWFKGRNENEYKEWLSALQNAAP